MNSFEQNEERIKADVNSVIQSVSNGGQPDMERLKEAGSDILSTAASLLSNAGIDELTGNSGATAAGGSVTGAGGIVPGAGGSNMSGTGNNGVLGALGGLFGGSGGSGSTPEAEAGDIMKKLRDGLGLDGNALDGLRKAADELKNKM